MISLIPEKDKPAEAYPAGTVFECRELGTNNWHETDDAGNEIALQFETVAEARESFRGFVANVREAIQIGSTIPECDILPGDFDLIAILPDSTEILVETGDAMMDKVQTR